MIFFNKLIDICLNCYESQKVVDSYFVGTNKLNRHTFAKQRNQRYQLNH